MRHLGQVLAHIHDQEIKIDVGPGPPPRDEPVQLRPGGARQTSRPSSRVACPKIVLSHNHNNADAREEIRLWIGRASYE
jgi:hypothetical protein